MKKRVLLLALAAICVAILASGTMAFFTAEEEVHNVITTDAVRIQIQEWQDRVGKPYPEEPIHAMPGTTVSKIATVKNLDAKAYIRAKVEVVITDADGEVMDLTPEALASIISLKMNGDDWKRKTGDSEWWYYDSAVSTGASTEPFFSEVVFDGPNMTNAYQNCTIEILVKAQAVQTANNGASAIEAAGWPAEELPLA